MRIRANLAALRTLRQVRAEDRPASGEEQQALGRWSGWGAVAQATFSRPEYAWARDQLRELLSDTEYTAAQQSTLNAHYTDAGLVTAIWHAIAELGFTDGQVLEPGCGSGHFIAFAPDSAHITGVELEPTSAAIAGLLHPQAQILTESFADSHIPAELFDLTIGNVPFGDITLHDPRHNPLRHAIHNHFLVKALHLTRPGGLVAAITSAYTLDAPTSVDARQDMAALADLVGAVRLPTGAHQKAAGTDVVTDVLILRRRDPDTPPAADDPGWLNTVDVQVGEHTVPINRYFLDHPELVLGTMRTGHGLHRPDELIVDGSGDVAPQLVEALDRIVLRAKTTGHTYQPNPNPTPASRPVPIRPAAERKPDGTLSATPGGGFTLVVDGWPHRHHPPTTQAAELRALLGLRDTMLALLDAEAATDDNTPTIDQLRTDLNDRYDAYHSTFGPINRFDWSTSINKAGRKVSSKRRPGQGGFRQDPHAAYVRALEIFDAQTQTAAKADIFRQRVIGSRPQPTTAQNPADAIALCLDRHGQLRLDVVADLLGTDPASAREALGTLVFDDPGSGDVVLAAEYLSGNVRAKLAAAKQAAADDPRFQANITALTEVIPHDLPPDQIYARLGGAWVAAEYVQQFLRETLEDPSIRVDHAGAAHWYVHTLRGGSVVSTQQWGIPQMPAHQIAQALLRKEKIQIWEDGPNRSRVINTEATAAVADKSRDLDERFGEWLWEDPERAAHLATVYNDTFNNHVDRVHDGSYLTLPGLQLNFRPHGHQLAAIERIITDNTVGLAHAVGAGKTSEMIIGVMELRRLGFVTKPLVAVPKNVIAQFAAEWLQRYPRARLLVAGSGDMNPQRRAAFLAKAASGDWDAVLMTHQGLERVPASAATRAAYLQRQVDEIHAAVNGAKNLDAHPTTVKELAAKAVRIEERVKAALAGATDDGMTFERAGFDYLAIDEGHLFKNLMLLTGLQDLMITGSQRASDLHMKFEYLRSRGGRVGLMGTATPWANKIIAELYNWQLFLDPTAMTNRGIHSFEQFVATFAVESTGLEVDLVGNLKVKTRLAALVNVPELMGMVSAATDIKTKSDLNLPIPLISKSEEGQRLPRTIVIPPTDEHLDLNTELAGRAADLNARRPQTIDGKTDNMFRIGNTGRYAALDLRLIGRSTDETTKVDVVAANVHRIWEANRDNTYLDPQGQVQPHRGALQIVFCDLATPGPGGGPKYGTEDDTGQRQRLWTFYEQLRDDLAARGLPADQVRFIHEADSDEEKGQLFAACLNGQVAVIIGSTGKMGVGSNIQRRAVALHHVDPPWRPADVEQREGRILRQGNQHAEVDIYAYVTGRSVDAYVWQAVQRKAHTLDQALRGRGGVRIIESPDELVITAGMIKAAAMDNPMLVEKEELQARLARLERRHKTFQAAQRAYAHTARTRGQDATIYLTAADEAQAALDRRINTRADAFALTLATHTYTSRPAADAALHQLVADLDRGVRHLPIGHVGGFDLIVSSTTHSDPQQRAVTFTLTGVPRSEVVIAATGMEYGHKVNLVTRIENRLYDIEKTITLLRQGAADAQQEADKAQARIGAPFGDQADYDAVRARLTEVDAQLAATSKAGPGSGSAPVTNSSVRPARPGSTARPTTATATATSAAVATVSPAPLPTSPRGFTATGPVTPTTVAMGGGLGSTDEILTVAVALTTLHGYTSRRDAQEQGGVATADLVRLAFTDRGDDADELRQALQPHLTRHASEQAARVRDWARNQNADTDYHRSLRQAAATDTVAPHQLAVLVSAVGGYLRDDEDTTITRASSTSQWQNSVGDPVTVDAATVMAIRSRTTSYGTATTIRLVDAAGHLYQWTTNTQPAVAVGDHVAIRARVKANATFHTIRETQLTRATLTALPARRPTIVDSESTGAAAESTPPNDAAPEDAAMARGVGGPAVADVITIEHWLAGQGRLIAATPRDLLAWLHQQIADAVSDPAVTQAARLNQFDEFTRLFVERLEQALTAGWDVHSLEYVELFRLYAANDTFRSEARAVFGLAAYTAIRADTTLPDDQYRTAAVIPPDRQRALIKAIEDHAARYATIGSPARYIAEAHVPGGASGTEWNWIAYYIHTHPNVLRRAVLTPDELTARDRAAAEALLTEADQALTGRDFDRALSLIDQAEHHYPAWNLSGARDAVRQSRDEHTATTGRYDTALGSTDPVEAGPSESRSTAAASRSHAAAAFAHPPRIDPNTPTTTEQPGHHPGSVPSRPVTR